VKSAIQIQSSGVSKDRPRPVQFRVRRYRCVMSDSQHKCPTCDALYELVRVEAPPNHDHREQVTCLSCGGVAAGRFAIAKENSR
jgi:hypothetical protein